MVVDEFAKSEYHFWNVFIKSDIYYVFKVWLKKVFICKRLILKILNAVMQTNSY